MVKRNEYIRNLSIIIFIVIIIFCANIFKNTQQIVSTKFEENFTSIAPSELTSDIIFNQKTVVLFENTKKIGVFFANYGNRANEGEVFINVYNQDEQLIGESKLSASEIGDGEYCYVSLNKSPSLGELINIEVSSNSEPGKAVTIWCNDNTFFNSKGAVLEIGGQEITGFHMNIIQEYESPQLSIMFWAVLFLLSVVYLLTGIPQYYYEKIVESGQKNRYTFYVLLFIVATVIICLRNLQFITTPIIYAEDGTFLSRQIKYGILDNLFVNRNGLSIFENSPEFPNMGTYIILWLATKTTTLLNGYDLSSLPLWNGIYSNMFFAFTAVLGYKMFEKLKMRKIGIIAYLLVIFVNLGTSSSEVLGRALNTQFLWTVTTIFVLVILYTKQNKTIKDYIFPSIFSFVAVLSFPICFAQILGYLIFDLINQRKQVKIAYTLKKNCILWLMVLFGVYKLPQLLQAQGAGIDFTFKIDSVVEFFIARHILFSFISFVYSYMTDAYVLVLFAVYIAIILYAWILEYKKYGKLFNSFMLFAMLSLGTCFSSAFMRRTMTQIFNNYTGTYPDRYFYACNILALVLFVYAIFIIMQHYKLKSSIKTACLSMVLFITLLNPYLFYFTKENYSQWLYGVEYNGTFAESCKEALNNNENLEIYQRVKIYPSGLEMELALPYVLATADSIK